MYLKHMVCVLPPLLSFIHHIQLEEGGSVKYSLHRNSWERFRFSLEIWIVHKDMFSAQVWKVTDGSIFVIHHRLSAPL